VSLCYIEVVPPKSPGAGVFGGMRAHAERSVVRVLKIVGD
jgi:hypothetical protein